MTATNMRRMTEAEFFVDRAVLLDPTSHETHWQKARLCLLTGDTAKARRSILDASAHVPRTEAMYIGGAFGVYNLGLWRFGLIDDDPAQIQREFSERFADAKRQVYHFCMAQLCELGGRPDDARLYYDSARVCIEEKVKASPDDFHLRCDLALAYAFLGRQEESIREGELALELMPIRACHW
jgi:tetratricopeptide (TPR) repeat protein